ncbi:hypothetical protein ACTOV4_01075 [Brucella sp. C7-11G]
MTIIHVDAPEASLSAKKYLPSVLDGLEAWHFMDGGVERAALNFALGKPDADIVGTPVAGEGYVRFKGLTNFLQGKLPEALEETTFIVARTLDALSSDATRPMLCGTFRNPAIADPARSSFGSAIYMTEAVTAHGTAGRRRPDGSFTSGGAGTVANVVNWALYCLTVSEATTVMRDYTTGTTRVTAETGTRDVSSGKHRIGSGFQQFGGECDIALYARYSRALDTVDRNALVTEIRQIVALEGVVV